MIKIVALITLLVVTFAAGAQPAVQFLRATQPDGQVYSETRDFSDLKMCRSLMRANLAAAKKLGYKTSQIGTEPDAVTYRDPKRGVAITQTCRTDQVFDPLPGHPTASFPNGGTAVGLAPPPVVVPCPKVTSRTAILVSFGQSNAANHGEGRYTAGPKVTVFHLGKCYQASDPLPGATGVDGSPWGRLGDLLVDQGAHDQVVIIATAAGGTFIADWAPGGQHHARLIGILKLAVSSGYAPTALLWHQGEADAAGGTKADVYKSAFLAMYRSIEAAGVRAPAYVAVATICAVRDAAQSPNQQMLHLGPGDLVRQVYDAHIIRAAQLDLAKTPGGMIRRGANTDTIGPEFRYDGCHISRRGQDQHAKLWFQALTTKH